MRCIRNSLYLAFIVAVLPIPSFGQEKNPAAAAQTQPVTSRPAASQPGTFQAQATLGPALPELAQPDEKGNVKYAIFSPVWDGVNNGLWVVLQDIPSIADERTGHYLAILVDPATGQEKKRFDAPSIRAVGHDGVGLWFEAEQPSEDGHKPELTLQRIRTAPELTPQQKEAGRQLPEDLHSPVSLWQCILHPRAPQISIYSIFHMDTQLHRIYLDLQASTMYQPFPDAHPRELAIDGAGYLWLTLDRRPHGDLVPELQRVPIDSLHVVRGRIGSLPIEGMQAANVDGVPSVGPQLAWDGQRLWALSRTGPDRFLNGVHRSHGEILCPPQAPVHLVSIDVGLTRHPDTTERHNKALAFEKKNGTLKAIPLFEQIIADDPAAAEVRNHLAWALGTRPNEPYHDIQRAKKLVEGALEWQPWDPEKWDTLAEIYWRLGDAKLAVHLESKAINLNPNKTFYWRQLDKFRTQPGTDKAPEPGY